MTLTKRTVKKTRKTTAKETKAKTTMEKADTKDYIYLKNIFTKFTIFTKYY